MTEGRPGQFEVVLSSGLRIERMPVGYAGGSWWASFVLSGVSLGDQPFHPRRGLLRDIFRSIQFAGPDGPLMCPGSGAGGGERVHFMHCEIEADAGLPWLRITYTDDGQVVATETIDLR
jgi:hypothetical protein